MNLTGVVGYNNAGVFLDFETEAKGLRRMFEETYAVNVFGAAIMADAFLPSLKKSTTEGGARILNLGSGLGCISTTSDPEGEFKGNHFIVRRFFPQQRTANHIFSH